LGGLVYSLGAYSVFQGFIYAVVPFVEKARVPAMAILLFHAAFATLAAFGVDALQKPDESPESNFHWLRRINIGVAAFGIVTGVIVMAVLIAKKFQWDMDGRIGITALVAILMAVLLYACRTNSLTRRQGVTLLILLLLFEVGNESSYMLADRNNPDRRKFMDMVRENGDIADFLHRQPGPFRVDTKTGDVVGGWGDFYNVDFLTSHAGVTVNTFRLETHTASTKNLLGAKFTLARSPTDAARSEVFRAVSGVIVYQNPDVFPRAWAVHEVVPINTIDQGHAFIENHVNELRWKALSLENPAPKLSACPDDAKDKVLVTDYGPTKVSINADMRCDGMVVLSDTYYPGWYARVDGQLAHIHEVNLALRGVPVARGMHTITFRYRPRSVFWGAGLTLNGLFAIVALTLWPGKNRHVAHTYHQ
jgi:hypothetical protein